MNFSLVIPTYNRQKDLADCLRSIGAQTLRPTEIIIIDDGALPTEFLNEWSAFFKTREVVWIYQKKDQTQIRRGLAESKNLALTLVNQEIFFIFDDDLVLDTDFLEKIMAVWATRPDDRRLLGVGGRIKNARSIGRAEKIYNRLFNLSSSVAWDINEAGFQVWDPDTAELTEGYYAYGGACSFRLSAARVLKFTVFSGGRTALEDVDFCLRAKNQGYYFLMEPAAVVFHKQSPTDQETEFLVGYKESFNRRLIFKNNCRSDSKNRRRFIRANVGWILRQFLAGHWRRGAGMIAGALARETNR